MLPHCRRDRSCCNFGGFRVRGLGCEASTASHPKALKRAAAAGPQSMQYRHILAAAQKMSSKASRDRSPLQARPAPRCGRRCGVACRQPGHHSLRTSRGAANSQFPTPHLTAEPGWGVQESSSRLPCRPMTNHMKFVAICRSRLLGRRTAAINQMRAPLRARHRAGREGPSLTAHGALGTHGASHRRSL